MTKANGKCNRCSGTGFRNCAQAHLGVSGLCFDCDGSGRYEDQAKRKAEIAANKKAEAAFRAITQPVYDKIWAVRRNAKCSPKGHTSGSGHTILLPNPWIVSLDQAWLSPALRWVLSMHSTLGHKAMDGSRPAHQGSGTIP